MKLWTIQEPCFYQRLKAQGYIQAEKFSVSDHPEHLMDALSQYEWLAKQTVIRGISKEPIDPIWAWYKYNGVHKKPDLRHSMHMPRGTKSVCIEFEAEEKKVLLSQFDLWCCVMNNDYLDGDEYETDIVEKLEKSGKLTASYIRQSWPRIFNLAFGSDDYWGPLNKRPIQACVAEIRIEQVTSVWEFIAK